MVQKSVFTGRGRRVRLGWHAPAGHDEEQLQEGVPVGV